MRLPSNLEVAEKAPNTYLRQDSDFYFGVLDQLRPDNLLVVLQAKDVETDTVESIYGTEYSYVEIKDGLYDSLAKAPAMASFTLPQPNPFVPEGVELLAERPVLLIDEPGLSLYYGQDREFQRPKVAMSFKVRIPGDSYSASIPSSAYSADDMVRWYLTATTATGETTREPAFPDPLESAEYLGTVINDPTMTAAIANAGFVLIVAPLNGPGFSLCSSIFNSHREGRTLLRVFARPFGFCSADSLVQSILMLANPFVTLVEIRGCRLGFP